MAAVYPVGLLLENEPVAVVGGDAGAADKVFKLLDAAARVTVYAPALDDVPLREAAAAGRVVHVARAMAPEDVAAYRLVLCLVMDAAYNARISAACRAARVVVNCFDMPAISDFSHPAQLRRGLLQIAIFTGGASPALARTIRQALEEAIDDRVARWLDRLNEYRERVKRDEPSFDKRKQLLYDALRGFRFKASVELPKDE